MAKLRQFRTAGAVALALIVGLVIGAAASGAGGLRSDLDGVRAQLASLTGKLTSANQSSSSLQSQNGGLQSRVDDLQTQLDAMTQENAKRPMPDLAGDTQADATAAADRYGWTLKVTEKESAKAPGTILSQKPGRGTVMHLGAVLTIVVAKPLPPKMPNLIGKTKADAEAVAAKHGWKLTVKREVSSQAPGTIISQTPAAGTFMRGAASFTVVIAKKGSSENGGGGGGGGTDCTPGYDPCLPPESDYDCYGGEGNGPFYTEPGVVYQVTGSDPYDLDRDGDGLGCE